MLDQCSVEECGHCVSSEEGAESTYLEEENHHHSVVNTVGRKTKVSHFFPVLIIFAPLFLFYTFIHQTSWIIILSDNNNDVNKK